MNEVILFGDIETALITKLTADLATRSDTAAVQSDGNKPSSPTPRPDRLVVVRRLGGARSGLVTDGASIEFHCYDSSETEAQELAQLIRALVYSYSGHTLSGLLIHRIEEYAAPARMPHPKSHNPRYVFTASVFYRGAAE